MQTESANKNVVSLSTYRKSKAAKADGAKSPPREPEQDLQEIARYILMAAKVLNSRYQ